MAAIYDAETGDSLALGLPGSDICDEAWQTAHGWDRPVVLEDDDGVWGIDGGEVHRIADAGEEWDGSSW